jgi:hypothetical protein
MLFTTDYQRNAKLVKLFNCSKFCPPCSVHLVHLLTVIYKYSSAFLELEYINGRLTACSRVLPEKPRGPQLVEKLSAFYGTRRFSTAFTSPRRLSLSCARSIDVPPFHLLKIYFNIIFPSMLGVPRGLSCFPPKLCMQLSCSPYVPHAPPITFCLILSPE